MRRVAQVFGLFFALVSIVLLIVSMVEKVKWVRITVDPSKLTSGIQINKLAYYSRERGIFKECWTNEKLDSSELSSDRLWVNATYIIGDHLATPRAPEGL